MRQYWLQQHVHVCTTRDYVVFLDLKNDTYLGVSLPQMDAIGIHLPGWPRSAHVRSDCTQPPLHTTQEGRSTLENLLQKELLTEDVDSGKYVTPTAAEAPSAALIETIFVNTLLDHESTPAPEIRFRDVLYFAHAYAVAVKMRRLWSIGRIVRHVQARKRHLASDRLRIDPTSAQRPAWLFRRIRPFFFSKKGACFLESLVLIEFLAHYTIFPDWIFGVQTGPFKAHCWIQAGPVVFNDSPFVVRTFTPILVV